MTKAHAKPVRAGEGAAWGAARFRPGRPLFKPWFNLLCQDARFSAAPVLPWKMSIPGAPFDSAVRGRFLIARQSQIADGNNVKTFVSGPGMPPTVSEGV